MQSLYVHQAWIQSTPSLQSSNSSFATATSSPIVHTLEEDAQGRSTLGLRTLCQLGRLSEALKVLESLDKQSLRIRMESYGELIQGCTKFKALDLGKQVHAHILNEGVEPSSAIENLLIIMYFKCGNVEEARKLFDKLPKRNVVAWTAIVSGAAQEGKIDAALHHFSQMQEEGVKPDAVFFISILNAFTSPKDIAIGKKIHLEIVQSGLDNNLYVANALISMYSRCGSLQEARKVFDKMSVRDLVSWTALLNLYCKLGCLADAKRLFNHMPMRDVLSWSTMIAGYANHGRSEDAFEVFQKMQESGLKPDKVTFLSILNACRNRKYLEHGKKIHSDIIKLRFESDVRLTNSLVKMYTKCGSLVHARQVFDKMERKDVISWTALLNAYITFNEITEARGIFDKMPKRDVICWNSMIHGYAKSGEASKAIQLFNQMEKEHLVPDDMTYVGVLNACARMRSLQQGLDIHSRVLISGLEGARYVQNALIDMYIKCGSLNTAQQFFERMTNRDVVSWNTLLFGLLHSGRRIDALNLYKRMQSDAISPDRLTFLGVLSACKKEGLFEEAKRHFSSMRRVYKVKPTSQHYSLLKKGVSSKSQSAKPKVKVPQTKAGAVMVDASLEAKRDSVECPGAEKTMSQGTSVKTQGSSNCASK